MKTTFDTKTEPDNKRTSASPVHSDKAALLSGNGASAGIPVFLQCSQDILYRSPDIQLQEEEEEEEMLMPKLESSTVQRQAIEEEEEEELLQPKLTVGAPDDEYEQEADRVSEQVMRKPEPVLQKQAIEEEEEELMAKPLLQRQPLEENEEIRTRNIQRKESNENTPAPVDIENKINQSKDSGQPLHAKTQSFMERRFGTDFSNVKVHNDSAAVQMNKQVNSQAFTVRNHIYFNSGRYDTRSDTGKQLLAHELTHTIQQGSSPIVRRTPIPANTTRLNTLRGYLDDGQEENAITLMGNLSSDEKDTVQSSMEFKELAVSCFNNEEMYRAVRRMRKNLYKSLEWVFEEGVNLTQVSNLISHINNTVDPTGKARVRADRWLRSQFVSLCNNEEMAGIVDLLQGPLREKLQWMNAEGSDFNLVKTKIQATTNPAERTAVHGDNEVLELLVSVCNNEEIVEIAELIGGTLVQKLRLLVAEGTDFAKVGRMIRLSPSTELPAVSTNTTVMQGLQSELSRSDYAQVQQMLSRITEAEISTPYTEQIYERTSPTAWALSTYGLTAAYQIQYTHSELAIVVRIELTGTATTPAQQQGYIDAIRNHWNNKYHIENGHRLRIVFEPVFTSSSPHHRVTMRAPGTTWTGCATSSSGSCRANAGNWFTNSSNRTIAHEFGHMISLRDEYRMTQADYMAAQGLTTAPAASPSGYTITSSLMGSGTGVAGRHFRPFLNWLNNNRQPGEPLYRLVRNS